MADLDYVDNVLAEFCKWYSIHAPTKEPEIPPDAAWLIAKRIEQTANEFRRKLEDEICAANRVESETVRLGGLKITPSESTTVDSEMLGNLARGNPELRQPARTAFRWTAFIRHGEFSRLSEATRVALAAALTTKPARPAFSWEPLKGKKKDG